MTEKSKGKKLLTWTLALSMTLALPPVGVFAEEGVGGEGSQQTNTAPATKQPDGSSNESGASNNKETEPVGTPENGGQNTQTAPPSGTLGTSTPSGEGQKGGNETLTPLPTPVSGGESKESEDSTTPSEGKDEGETTGEVVTYAATIDGKEGTTYETLQAAIDAAENGDTVVLAKDVTANININKSITLDLNGKTLTGLGDDSVVTITGSDTEVTVTSSVEEKGKITGGIGSKEHKNLFGGGLFIVDATVELENLIVTKNQTVGLSGNYARTGGGGIAAVNAAVTLNNVAVTENNRSAISNGGGGIFAEGGSLTIKGSTIEGNSSNGTGGGIFAENTLLNIDTSFIQENHTQTNGGGIYIANDRGICNQTHPFTFSEKVTTMPEGESSISNTTIGDNIANGLGGGMYIGGGHCLRISNSTITDNRVEDSSGNGQGGGIVAYTCGNLTLDNTKIIANKADSGGGIFLLNTSGNNPIITLKNDTQVSENKASGYGGGIYAWPSAKNASLRIILNRASISNNTSAGGSGIFTFSSSEKARISIELQQDAVLCNNKATSYGGGIYAYNYTDITAATDIALYNNTADTAGDDLFLNGGTTFTLPKATDMSGDKILTADGEKITGWFYDGWGKPRWGDGSKGSKYYDEYTPIAGETTPMALKAAHEQLYKVTVHYVYSDGATAKADAVINVKAGAAYSIDSPAIEGYKADKATVSGTISAETPADTEITVTYTKESSGGGGGGGHRPKPKPTVEIPDDDALGLNNTDHFAYIVGYGNGEVQPQNSITRAEVAAIFFRLLEDGIRNENFTHQNDFSDVAADAWYCSSVSTLSRMGIIAGYPDGTFRPNAPITRAEFAAIATRFDNNGDKTPVSFTDIIGHWAEGEITVAANHGWVSGYGDNTFRPQNQITRAETMSLVNRVLKRLPETSADLLPDMITWTDNADTSSWYYLPVQEATNSHYYEFKENSKHEKWTELRETRDWSKLN